MWTNDPEPMLSRAASSDGRPIPGCFARQQLDDVAGNGGSAMTIFAPQDRWTALAHGRAGWQRTALSLRGLMSPALGLSRLPLGQLFRCQLRQALGLDRAPLGSLLGGELGTRFTAGGCLAWRPVPRRRAARRVGAGAVVESPGRDGQGGKSRADQNDP